MNKMVLIQNICTKIYTRKAEENENTAKIILPFCKYFVFILHTFCKIIHPFCKIIHPFMSVVHLQIFCFHSTSFL
jgi:hypothetical protein